VKDASEYREVIVSAIESIDADDIIGAHEKLVAARDDDCAACRAMGEDCGEHVPSWEEIVARLQAENERLRAGLRMVVNCNVAEPWRLTARLMQDIARAALSTSPTPAEIGETRADGEPVEIGYVNWRGEYSRRHILPTGIFWGSTEWHPKPQWLIEAMDVEKGVLRTFALADIGTKPPTEEPRNG